LVENLGMEIEVPVFVRINYIVPVTIQGSDIPIDCIG
jgi:hypothetical protein